MISVFIEKDNSAVVFNLSYGQKIKLFGKVETYKNRYGQEFIYFIASKVETLKLDINFILNTSVECPDSTKDVNFAKIMDMQFAEDFEGCNLQSIAVFLGTGTGGYFIPSELKVDYVPFMCYPKNNLPANNPLSGQRVGNFVFINKTNSSKVFNLSSGQEINLFGKVYISDNRGYKSVCPVFAV